MFLAHRLLAPAGMPPPIADRLYKKWVGCVGLGSWVLPSCDVIAGGIEKGSKSEFLVFSRRRIGTPSAPQRPLYLVGDDEKLNPINAAWRRLPTSASLAAVDKRLRAVRAVLSLLGDHRPARPNFRRAA